MSPTALYLLTAFTFLTGMLVGWAGTRVMRITRERRRDDLWTEADYEWLNSQLGDH